MLDLEDRLDELNQLGLHQRMRMVSGPQGPRVVLDGRPVLAAVLRQRARARRPSARAPGRGRRGDALGRRRRRRARVVRDDDAAPPARGAARLLHRPARGAAVRLGLAGQPRRDPGARAPRRGRPARRAQPLLDRRRLPALRRRRRRLPPRRRRPPRVGAAPVRRPRGADRHRRHVRHGRRRRAAARRSSSWRSATTCACSSTRRTRSARSAPAAAARSPRRASRARSTSSPARSARRSAPTAASSACDHVTARFLVHSARTLLHSTALPPVAAAAAMAALDLLEEQPRRVEKLRANAEALRDGLAREGFDVSGAAAHVVPLVVGDAELAGRIVDHALEQGVFAEAVRPPAVPEGTARVRLAVMASHTRAELRDAASVARPRGPAGGLPPGRRRAGRRRPAGVRPPRGLTANRPSRREHLERNHAQVRARSGADRHGDDRQQAGRHAQRPAQQRARQGAGSGVRAVQPTPGRPAGPRPAPRARRRRAGRRARGSARQRASAQPPRPTARRRPSAAARPRAPEPPSRRPSQASDSTASAARPSSARRRCLASVVWRTAGGSPSPGAGSATRPSRVSRNVSTRRAPAFGS